LSQECVEDLVLGVVLEDEGGLVAEGHPEAQKVEDRRTGDVYQVAGKPLTLCHALDLIGITG
jgi:hypothetical protein